MIPQRIVALGTSAFFGVGDPLHGGYIGRLKVWHESKDEDNVVFNLGITGRTTGETTTQILQRLPEEVSVRDPDLVLLTSGINDIKRHESRENPPITSQETFRENVTNIIDKAKTFGDVVFISTIPIKEKLESSDNYLLPKDLGEYAAIVKTVCEEKDIPYLDIYNQWKQKDYFSLLTKDGVHPNEKGHEMIFESLKDFLENLYK